MSTWTALLIPLLLPLEIVIGPEVLAIILSAGTGAMIIAIVQAYRSLRDGARAEDKDAFAELESSRATEARLRSRAEVERDYWHARAGDLEWIIRTKLGPEAVPAPKPMPEDKTEETVK